MADRARRDARQRSKNNPALKGLTIPRTGQSGHHRHADDQDAGDRRREPGSTTTSTGVRGAMLRAYDKATGKEVGAVYMPAPQTGSPMTYMLNGKQYIVVAISGGNYSGELIAFRLPARSLFRFGVSTSVCQSWSGCGPAWMPSRSGSMPPAASGSAGLLRGHFLPLGLLLLLTFLALALALALLLRWSRFVHGPIVRRSRVPVIMIRAIYQARTPPQPPPGAQRSRFHAAHAHSGRRHSAGDGRPRPARLRHDRQRQDGGVPAADPAQADRTSRAARRARSC